MSPDDAVTYILSHKGTEEGTSAILSTYVDPGFTELPSQRQDAFAHYVQPERLLTSLYLYTEKQAVACSHMTGPHPEVTVGWARVLLAEHTDPDHLRSHTAHYLLDYHGMDHVGSQTAHAAAVSDTNSFSWSDAAIPERVTTDDMFNMRRAWASNLAFTARHDADFAETLADYAVGDSVHARAAMHALTYYPALPATQRAMTTVLAHDVPETVSQRLPVDDLVAGILWDKRLQEQPALTPTHLTRAIALDTVGSFSAKALGYTMRHHDAATQDLLIDTVITNESIGVYGDAYHIWDESGPGATPSLLTNPAYAVILQEEEPASFYTRAADLSDMPATMKHETVAKAARHHYASSDARCWILAHNDGRIATDHIDLNDIQKLELHQPVNAAIFRHNPQPFLDRIGTDTFVDFIANADLTAGARDTLLAGMMEGLA